MRIGLVKMKETFSNKLGLSKSNISKLQVINNILEEYEAEGYKLSLRQLYYQLVSKNIISNNIAEYTKLSVLLTKGRMGGVVDWEIIEDRVRKPHLRGSWESPKSILRSALYSYRKDRQKGQNTYIEVWIEKDALSGVLKKVCEKYHINLMVNRGYSSTSAMYDSFKRFEEQIDKGKNCVILYLGDHDPSGLDMIRDIKERLDIFGVDVEVKAIALTQSQIKQYNPPPNPAKIKDKRADNYIREFGRVCWEVDALTPQTLNSLVEKHLLNYIDMDLYNQVLKDEEKDKLLLEKVMDNWSD